MMMLKVVILKAMMTFAFVHQHRHNGLRVSSIVRPAATLDDVAIGSPLEPLSNYILVQVASTVDATLGGVLLPDKAKEKPTEGIVVACGPGRTHPDTGVLMPVPVAEGERVLYGKYDGTPVKYNGEDHQLIRDDDVLLAWEGDFSVDTVRPVRDRILVTVQKVEDVTNSGIALAPGVAEQQKTSTGQVVKLGEGRLASSGTMMPMPVEVGDFVKYRDYAGSDVKIQSEDYVVCRVTDCLAKWQD